MSRVDIGFAEECEPWQVNRIFFPSKIGGKPAWLNPQNLPDPSELECSTCNKPMIFLCQVYAPFEEDVNNFHRTLFIFICRNGACSVNNSSNNMVVYRCNLKRDNLYYSYEPPMENPSNVEKVQKYVSLCEICGCFAPKRCSKCKIAAYCSREHQVFHWKESHKNSCGNGCSDQPSQIVFNEYELLVEPEEIEENQVDEEIEINKFNQLEQEGKTGTLNEVSETELDMHAAITEDKTFMAFQNRISCNKEQVLRYERGGEPLWIAKEPLPSIIPNCENCDSERQFEFQIMPQMLTILKEIEVDWGVLAIYSCKKSCDTGIAYKKEFIFKQDVGAS